MDQRTDKASYRSAYLQLKITEKNGKNGGGKEKSPKIGGDWKPESLPTLVRRDAFSVWEACSEALGRGGQTDGQTNG